MCKSLLICPFSCLNAGMLQSDSFQIDICCWNLRKGLFDAQKSAPDKQAIRLTRV
jgi:hypothetical protein